MKPLSLFGVFLAGLWLPSVGNAMHIMEGFLPKEHSVVWLCLTAPFVIYGIRQINIIIREYPERKMILGLAAAFIFVLSALKIPSVTGSSSHPTGVGLSAIFFGPAVSSVLSGIVLLFQALLLAHGGLTTWGANTFSMGIAGAATAWFVFKFSRLIGLSDKVAIFSAAALADWVTYLVTASQLSLAFSDPQTGFIGSFIKFAGVFAITQLPLAICEGVLSVIVFNSLQQHEEFRVFTKKWAGEKSV